MNSRIFSSRLFYLCALEGVVALVYLLWIPSEGGNVSLARFALICVPFFFCILFTYLGYRPPHNLDKLARTPVIYSTAILSLVVGLCIFLLRYLDPERFLPVYERLSPLLWYFLLLVTQATFFLLYLQKGFQPSNLVCYKPVYVSTVIALAVLVGVFGFIMFTRLGITPDQAYWGEPGVPILGWQLAVALTGGVFVFCLVYYLRPSTLDVILPVFIYVLALLLWLSVPVGILKNSYYMPLTAPNFQPFPYSDSMYYDETAQSVLIGYPYHGSIPTRPLYITFLTVLHFVFGENYPRILMGQTFVLALMPVVLYWVGKKLHGYVAGVTVALFLIFRELTSLLISSDTRVTNTKMILVDLPTLFLLLVACLFALRWLERKDARSAFIAGGFFGVLLLLRTQSLLILPFLMVVAFLIYGWQNKSLYHHFSVYLIALAIAIAPWLVHNYLLTGELAFDAAFQYKVIASQYAYSGNLDISNYEFQGKGLGRVLMDFAIKDPKFVFGFIANHFLATQINGLLSLPLIEPYNGLFEPINLYWMTWDGQLAWYNMILIIVYLIVISFGLGAVWIRWRWLGLLPLAFSVGYALATAMARFSSWRYDFPADWISYFYFGIGFAEILRHVASLFGQKDQFADLPGTKVKPTLMPGSAVMGNITIVLVFMLIGGSPWLIKNLAKPRYPDQSAQVLITKLSSIDNAPTPEEINGFISQPESFLQIGRLLYPRFFYKNSGLSSAHPSTAYVARDYARFGFIFLNQSSIPAVFPTKEISGVFPHAADAIILGCRRENYLEVRLIAFPDLDILYTGTSLSTSCSS